MASLVPGFGTSMRRGSSLNFFARVPGRAFDCWFDRSGYESPALFAHWPRLIFVSNSGPRIAAYSVHFQFH